MERYPHRNMLADQGDGGGLRGAAVKLLLLLSLPVFSGALEAEVAVKVSSSVFRDKGLSHVVAVLCQDADALLWERYFADLEGFRIATPQDAAQVQENLKSATTDVGVFVHLGCSRAWSVLEQSSSAGLLHSGLHWLLAGNASTLRSDLVRAAETLDLAVDSEVTLAALAPGTRMMAEASTASPSTGTVHLVDAYRVTRGTPLLTRLTATWTESSGLTHFHSGNLGSASSASTRRRNLQGVVLRAGVLVDGALGAGELAKALGKQKDNDPQVSPVAAFSHMLTARLQETLNITLLLQSGSFFELMDRMSRNELHLVTTAVDMQAKYWDILDYLAMPVWVERSVLILKNPSALWSYDAWTRPLDGPVWLIVVITILATAAVLRAVGHFEVRMVRGHAEEEDTWPAALTTALSMVCAQGFTNTTNWTSGRAMLLVFEFFSLFINLFYSSGIVTFLLTFPPPFAHTIREVIDSPFVAGVDKSVLGAVNFTESRDALLRELYDKKISVEAGGGGFLDLEEAGDLGRRGLFAIVGSPLSMYEMLAMSWSQSDICRIQEIELQPPALLTFATAKRSPFREILNQGILLLVERGLLERERGRWSVARPRCDLSDVAELDDVGMRQVTPVLGILVLGLALSITFLSVEVAFHKFNNRKTKVIDLLKDLKMKADGRKKVA